MSKQHRYLFGIIALASLVTIIFQCFWLYGNYQNEQTNFITYAERLLFESIQEEREIQLRQFYPEIYHHFETQDPRGKLFNTPSFHEQRIPRVAMRGIVARALAVQNQDSMRVRLMPTALLSINLDVIQKGYQKKMGTDLQSSFYLDTVKMTTLPLEDTLHNKDMHLEQGISTLPTTAAHPMGEALPAMPATAIPVTTIHPTLTVARRLGPVMPHNRFIARKFPIQATSMMIDPSKGTFLVLYLKTPTLWILKRLAWALVSSLLLISLTVGCLIYMLYTIFKQKKIADIKNDFVNNMTHELKTPLATVLAATESLQQFSFEESQQKASLYLQMSHKAATHLTSLIDQILHLAVGEKQGLHLQMEPVDTFLILQQLVEMHQLANNCIISLSVEKDIPLILMDKMHISNAISNLLDNAVKYTDHKAKIWIKSSVLQNRWLLSVEDDGMGIGQEDIKHIFQPFYRVPTGDTHRVKGFGLGLHYVKQVITQHKGHIEVDSIPLKGTKFTLSLPLSI